MAEASLKGGEILISLKANIVLPVPGGPIKIRLCPPAAAISSARLACGWPATSDISKALALWCWGLFLAVSSSGLLLLRCAQTSKI